VNAGDGRQSIEKELYNQVTNVVSSFLFKYDTKNNHQRQNSKSDLGFVKPNNRSQLDSCARYENTCEDSSCCPHSNNENMHNVLKEYNGCQMYQPQCYSSCQVQQNSFHKNYISDQNTLEETDIYTSMQNDRVRQQSNSSKRGYRINERDGINGRDVRDGSKSCSTGGHQVSSHLMGLNKLVKRIGSPVHREDINYLMNSGNSMFDTSQPTYLTARENRKLYDSKIMEEESSLRNSEDYKENCKELATLSCDELFDTKSQNDSEEDDQHIDENIEMERIAKMNFYTFKSYNQKGIVGMCQDLNETRIKSPAVNRIKSPAGIRICHQSPDMKESMKNKYKSFLDKSVNSCANLMISNNLLKNKNNNNKDRRCINMPLAKHQL
jgi:hypothetical protein